jgi:membrane associated rhomboid family serine protease
MIPLRDNVRGKTFPFVTWLLIAVNVAVFIKEVSLPEAALEAFIQEWALIPKPFWSDMMGEAPRLVTSMFLHGGWMHIIGNMLFLHIFGDNVEDRMGHGKFFLFYLLAGVGAALAQAHLSSASMIPMLGASGAIAGVLGAYFVYHPHARVLTLIPLGFFTRVIEVPAFLFLGLWFVIQAFSGTMSIADGPVRSDVGGVAWWAHAGGFVIGLVLSPVLRRR